MVITPPDGLHQPSMRPFTARCLRSPAGISDTVLHNQGQTRLTYVCRSDALGGVTPRRRILRESFPYASPLGLFQQPVPLVVSCGATYAYTTSLTLTAGGLSVFQVPVYVNVVSSSYICQF